MVCWYHCDLVGVAFVTLGGANCGVASPAAALSLQSRRQFRYARRRVLLLLGPLGKTVLHPPCGVLSSFAPKGAPGAPRGGGVVGLFRNEFLIKCELAFLRLRRKL